jgi:hypothetical protein
MSAVLRDMLLESAGCLCGRDAQCGATALGIELRDAHLQAEGDLDFRGTLGLAKDVPGGFPEHSPRDRFSTHDASEEQLTTLLRLTERYCVVYQTLMQPPKIAVTRRKAEDSAMLLVRAI